MFVYQDSNDFQHAKEHGTLQTQRIHHGPARDARKQMVNFIGYKFNSEHVLINYSTHHNFPIRKWITDSSTGLLML